LISFYVSVMRESQEETTACETGVASTSRPEIVPFNLRSPRRQSISSYAHLILCSAEKAAEGRAGAGREAALTGADNGRALNWLSKNYRGEDYVTNSCGKNG